MPRQLYVILDFYGKCWEVKDDAIERIAGLPSLLEQGWRPVRETPFPPQNGYHPCILILLERD